MHMIDAMREMHTLLRGQRSPQEIAARLHAPVERLAAYQRFVKNHVLSVLNKIYPSLRLVMGDELWAELCARYFAEVPASDYELNAAAERLADFIDKQAATPGSPLTLFHAELAVLEWAEFAAYVDEVSAPAGEPSQERPLLNPTVRVLRFWYPVAEFLAAHRAWQQGQRPSPPASPQSSGAAEIVFVLRHPQTLAYRYAVADRELLLAFKMAHDGLSVAEVAAQSELGAADVEVIVQRAADLGLVLTGRDSAAKPTTQVKISKQAAA